MEQLETHNPESYAADGEGFTSPAQLRGRVALVTGGSRGIGRAAALALAGDGATVAVNYRSGKDEAHQVVADIEATGGRAAAFGADVSDYEQARSLVADVLNAFGEVHMLVNNAGVSKDNLIYTMEPEDWLDVMRVNFGGVFNCTKALLDHFMVTRDGTVVNVSSVMGERGWTGESNYAASKGAVNAFTRSAAIELARFGVRVNAVLPGFAPTDLVADLATGDVAKHLKRQIPMRDFATVEQVASAIRFLAGPESAYMTGVLLNIDGGGMAGLGLGRLKW